MHNPVTTPETAEAITDAVHRIYGKVLSLTFVPHPLCPEDGTLLAHPLEPCPTCRYWAQRDVCARCGIAVHPDLECPGCLLYRLTGRRPLVRVLVGTVA
jgi:hypothetical protein